MAEKLKSILKQTNWSLVLRAIIFGAAWFALPFWLFLLVALYLYFVPIAGVGKVAAPFLVLLVISFLEGPNLFFAVILAGIFYLILLIKDLIIIDRTSAYEVLVLILTYLLARSFFMKVGGDFGGRSLFYSILAAWAVGAMVSSLITLGALGTPGAPLDAGAEARSTDARPFLRAVNWVFFILIWQIFIAGLFLPLDFVYQSAIVFLMATALIDLVPRYVSGELSREKIFATSAVIFTLLVIVVASGRWTL